MLADIDLEDVTVEESVIFPETTVRGGEIWRSIVDEDTHVEGLNLSSAAIGAHPILNGLWGLPDTKRSFPTGFTTSGLTISLASAPNEVRRGSWLPMVAFTLP